MCSSELCDSIKNRICWDKILISPAPHSNVIHEGYRINISLEKEEDIQQAKEILKQAGIVFDDRRATSFSDSVQPGDRTLRVIHQNSVTKLRRMWTEEFERQRLAQVKKKQSQRG